MKYELGPNEIRPLADLSEIIKESEQRRRKDTSRMTAATTERMIMKIRYEHRADIHLAFLQLGCALISLRFLG